MPWEPHSTATLTDPGRLRDRDDVEFVAETNDVDAAAFETATGWDSHVAVGVTGDRGVLLMNDGHHGWTLPAFAVESGDDWLAVARSEFESLTGVAVTVDAVELVRRREFRLGDEAPDSETSTDDQTTVDNVLVRATPADDSAADGSLSADPESRDDDVVVQWFDGVPDGVEGPVAADIERIVA